jgi:hypothetical protein
MTPDTPAPPDFDPHVLAAIVCLLVALAVVLIAFALGLDERRGERK